MSMDTTLNTNIFTLNTCPKCLKDDIPAFFNITYNKKKLALGQVTENILLSDDNNLQLSEYPINIMYSGEDSIEIPFDGVLGLGLDSFIKGNTSTNLLNYLFQMNYIETRQFSFALYLDDNKTKLIMGVMTVLY